MSASAPFDTQAERLRHPWEASYPPGVAWDAPIATTTLPALLDRSVQRFGDAPALRFAATRMSYAELGQRVDRLAAGLIAQGLRPGQKVALYLPNTLYHPLAFFAVLRAGGVVVHLSPLDPLRALLRKLADSEAAWVIATDVPALVDTVQLLSAQSGLRVLVGADAAWSSDAPTGLPDADPLRLWPRLDVQDLALLQYTGGTTGQPKAVMLSHANLSASVSIGEVWNNGQGRGFSPQDRLLGVLPLFHIFALSSMLIRGLAAGAEILLQPRFDAAAIVDVIEHQRATVFQGVPTMWTALANLPGIESRDLSSLRLAFSGGAPLPVEISRRLEALTGHRLGGGWGMTETSPVGTTVVAGNVIAPGEIGLPLPGIELQVVSLDDPRRILPPGETGELRIRGPNVTQGYWNRPEENAHAFIDGFFLTGDVGYMAEDGSFFLIDRKKDMIISGGFNVYPRMIEDAIYEHPDVAEAAVVGVPDAYRGQAAKAFVVLRDKAANLTLDSLRSFLAERVGKHELPTALEIRDTLPKTAAGKLSRRDLLEPAA